MIVTNIISAIGNNSSIYPLLVRDCCIEAPSKILIARKENLKESKPFCLFFIISWSTL